MRMLVVPLLALLMAPAAVCQACDETVDFILSPGAIEVSHSQVEYNCCASIETEIQMLDYDIDIFEREQMEEPCDCLCCFDINVQLAGLAAGEYTLQIWKNSEYAGGIDVLYGTWIVSVDGFSEPFTSATYIPCVQTETPDDAGTWGTIKALYR